MLTSEDHLNGTSRCAEVAEAFPDYEVVINIQGDEPFISPKQISDLIHCFDDKETELASMYKKIKQPEEVFDPHVAKVVMNLKGEALFFSRSPIPFLRNVAEHEWLNKQDYYYHVGIYGYKSAVLFQLINLDPSPLELSESLEQLRWLEYGFKIKMAETDIDTIAIDTPEDLEKIK
ncbi:3-deoxy-manno-octulosonate cytidylyltransferase [compost metagenome]